MDPWETSHNVSLKLATTDQILSELEERARNGPGQWTGHQCERVKVLNATLNRVPIND